MPLESTVGVAKTNTKSLRTTIPEGIVEFLKVNEGDKLLWEMDGESGGFRIVEVRKKA